MRSYVDVLIRVAVTHNDGVDPEDLVNDADYSMSYNAEDGRIDDTEITEVVLAGRVGDGNVLVREDGKTGRTASIRHSPSVEECAIDTDPNKNGIQTQFIVKKGVSEASGLDQIAGIAACYPNPHGAGSDVLVLVHNRDPEQLAQVVKDQTNGSVILELVSPGSMRVEFVEPCEIEVYESYDEAADQGETTTETFEAGDKVEWDVIDHPCRMLGGDLIVDPNLLNVQFGDGSVAFGISRSWFKEL